MLKQMIFAVLALSLLGQVEGKAIDHTTIFPNAAVLAEEAPTSAIPFTAPVSAGWTSAGTIIKGNPTGNSYVDVFQMMQGRVAGLVISGSPNNYRMRIRGASAPPMVVIDGMRFFGYDDAAINNLLLGIPPADVASIEVLKRITDTILYGPGSANGVIVVHTRPAGS